MMMVKINNCALSEDSYSPTQLVLQGYLLIPSLIPSLLLTRFSAAFSPVNPLHVQTSQMVTSLLLH